VVNEKNSVLVAKKDFDSLTDKDSAKVEANMDPDSSASKLPSLVDIKDSASLANNNVLVDNKGSGSLANKDLA
jgi:hypothetical protein